MINKEYYNAMSTLSDFREKYYQDKQFTSTLTSQKTKDITKVADFVDELFPPGEASIYSGRPEINNYEAVNTPAFLEPLSKSKFMSQYSLKQKTKDRVQYEWIKLRDLFKQSGFNVLKEPKEIKEFPDILTEDVKQGELGDCYFLSVLAALAEDPRRIRDLFPNVEVSKNGCYIIKCYIHGEPREIVIDDHFPCKEVNGEMYLAFSHINEKTQNVWPLLLEKAWAKINLNYENIIAGNASEAFEFLTPAPFDTYYHDVHEGKIFERILEADKKNYIICCDITDLGGDASMDFLAKMGLITNHAYTVIGAEIVTDARGQQIKLLKIRNPWGSNEWLGDWSDDSPKWTPELREVLNHKSEEDGTFWMCYEDFLKFYTTTHICKISNGYTFKSLQLPFVKDLGYNFVKVDVNKDGHGFFVVNQKNTRIYRHSKKLDNFENMYCSVLVMKEDGNGGFSYVGATCGRQTRLYVEANLTRGSYYVAVSFPHSAEKINTDLAELQKQHTLRIDHESFTYRVGVYSSIDRFELGQINPRDFEKFTNFLKNLAYDMANNNGDKYYLENEGEKDSWRAVSFENDAGSYGYIVYYNASEGIIKERLKFSQFYGVNLIPLLNNGDIDVVDINHEDYVADADERHAIQALKEKTQFESHIHVINAADRGDVTQRNPLEIEVSIAPKSTGVILIEKYEEQAGIDLSSQLSIVYPIHSLLSEVKIPSKKQRLKYNNNLVEIYECLLEHNSGVIFKYKNKTMDLKAVINLNFPILDNLKLSMSSEMLDDGKIIRDDDDEAEKIQNGIRYVVEDSSNEIVIAVCPGETKFFSLDVIDSMKPFAYSATLDYNMNKHRSVKKD